MAKSACAVLGLLAVATLCGCSHAAPAPRPPSAKDLAVRMGCTQPAVPANLPADMYSEVICYLPDRTNLGKLATAYVVTFRTSSAQRRWLEYQPQDAVRRNVSGSLWTVTVIGIDPEPVAQRVRERLA